jgi:hypothetical protein
MAGFTAFSTGLVNNRLVYLPITAITANSPRRMNPRGRTYERLLQTTRQPEGGGDGHGGRVGGWGEGHDREGVGRLKGEGREGMRGATMIVGRASA